MNQVLQKLLFSVLFICVATLTYAQQRTVTGTVTDEQGTPLAGVSYTLVGLNAGGTTNETGTFSVTVRNNNTSVQFSYVGYQTQTVNIGTQSRVSVTMKKSEDQLEGVVVTALGIRREQRKLGYATTTLTSRDIIKSAPTNFASALYGKAPGV